MTIEQLERANREIINGYRRFPLPRYWGGEQRVAADGYKWDLYEHNLLAEYHLRYGWVWRHWLLPRVRYLYRAV